MIEYNELISEIGELKSFDRRKELSTLMGQLGEEKKDCFSCSGMCCTFAYNSMLITPLEAVEIIIYLKEKNRLNKDTDDLLDEAIKSYRLDHELSIGRGREFRRNYTCPFYLGVSKGCSVRPANKPYGCLGFNPRETNVSVEGKCKSYEGVLVKREESNTEFEVDLNSMLRERLDIPWTKKNIPIAVKEILSKINLK